MSGYTACACRDCFETAIAGADDAPALCGACEEAGCSPDDGECQAPHAYCDGGEVDGACAACGAPF
jgi:hypothetical protein